MSVYNIKQYIVINKAAKWTHGKYATQCAHASMAVIFNMFRKEKDFKMIENGVPKEWYCYDLMVTPDVGKWIDGSFAKIVLKDEGICGLYDLEMHAKQFEVPTALVKDSGATQELEDDEQGQTLAIGPFDTDNPKYEPLMKHLSKLRLY